MVLETSLSLKNPSQEGSRVEEDWDKLFTAEKPLNSMKLQMTEAILALKQIEGT